MRHALFVCGRRAVALVIYLAGLSFAVAQTTTPRLADYTIDNLVDLYIEIALSTEPGTDTDSNGVLVKWALGSSVRILPRPSQQMIEQNGLDLFINETKRVTDSLASQVKHPSIVSLDRTDLLELAEKAKHDGAVDLENTVAVYIATRAQLLSKMEEIRRSLIPPLPDYLIAAVSNASKPACVGYDWWRKDEHVLVRGFVFIEFDPATLDACLYEEIMQAFGLFNDLPAGAESIFNDDDVYGDPTVVDLMLWRVHADPRLEPGMTEGQIRPLAREIISELLFSE